MKLRQKYVWVASFLAQKKKKIKTIRVIILEKKMAAELVNSQPGLKVKLQNESRTFREKVRLIVSCERYIQFNLFRAFKKKKIFATIFHRNYTRE